MGRAPYATCVGLLATAAGGWEILDGEAALKGVDPIRLPFHRFLNLIYYWAIRSMNEEKRAEFDTLLLQPPKSRAEKPSQMEAEDEGAAFLAFQSRMAAGA